MEVCETSKSRWYWRVFRRGLPAADVPGPAQGVAAAGRRVPVSPTRGEPLLRGPLPHELVGPPRARPARVRRPRGRHPLSLSLSLSPSLSLSLSRENVWDTCVPKGVRSRMYEFAGDASFFRARHQKRRGILNEKAHTTTFDKDAFVWKQWTMSGLSPLNARRWPPPLSVGQSAQDGRGPASRTALARGAESADVARLARRARPRARGHHTRRPTSNEREREKFFSSDFLKSGESG